MDRFIGIEAGGTKFVCVHGTNPHDLKDRVVFPTRSTDETMGDIFDYIKTVQEKHAIAAIGIASFGPVDLDVRSPNYGSITATPKPGWMNFNIVQALKQAFQLPVGFDTDVNAAAFAEHHWGASKGLSDCLYITVGTGIGVGAMANGQLLHGAMHPEMGHIFVPHDGVRDPFEGVCPYHHDCLEGLAAGPAMSARWQVASALELEKGHPAWELEAHYLALALANYTMCLSPERIVMGGGVMKHLPLLDMIKPKVIEYLAGYIAHPTVLEAIDAFIVRPGLGDDSGICGALALAEQAINNER